MFELTLTAPISLLVSLTALMGVTLHDTKFDKFASSLVGAGSSSYQSNSDAPVKLDSAHAHTHVERVHLNDSVQPRIVPRDEQKRHMLQKSVPKGAHRHDGYALPLD